MYRSLCQRTLLQDFRGSSHWKWILNQVKIISRPPVDRATLPRDWCMNQANPVCHACSYDRLCSQSIVHRAKLVGNMRGPCGVPCTVGRVLGPCIAGCMPRPAYRGPRMPVGHALRMYPGLTSCCPACSALGSLLDLLLDFLVLKFCILSRIKMFSQ